MRPDMPSIRVSRRGKIVIGVLISLFVLLSVLGSLVRVYTNWLWFGEVGYRGVFSTILWTRIALFATVGLAMALIIGANVFLAYRMRPPFRPISQEQENLERYRVALEPRKRLIFGALVALIFLAAGMSAQSNWKTWQLWRNGESFGVQDPQFHRDISFFAWDYPAYRLLLGLAFNAVVFSLLLSLAVHYVFGAFRIATPGPKLTISARRHVTLLVFFFIVLKACAYWLDRYGLVFSGRGKVTGASYTDVNASLPAKTILFWVAVLIALAVLASLWLKSAQIPIISFVVLLILSIGINGIYPAIVQQVTVKPNASEKEVPYIGRNIEATRQAYGIVKAEDGGNVTYQHYSVTARPDNDALTSTDPTVSNLRILDPNVVSPTFSKFQQLRNQYGFPTKLDIDRYEVDGQRLDYVVGVRELDQSKLTGNQTNWINAHTFYTHGYGFAAAAASSDVTNTKEFSEGDIPPKGPLDLSTPQVYYGELLPSYSIVGAAGSPREYDGADVKTTYAGSGGVPLSNIFKRLAFGIKYRETNFLLNDAASAKGAKIMFDRNPRQRVEKVAPFLTVDGDPYPAVIDGRVQWIVDAYTTIANYPYSERQNLSDLTTDSLTATNRTASQADSQVNYIRNSVKATVDAYSGKVTLYAWDEKDPVLKTWMKVFPNLVQKQNTMPGSVLAHVRYPQDLFEVQRKAIEQYHMDSPRDFYNVADKWTVPNDPYLDSAVAQPPYYVLASAPGSHGGRPQFQLTTPMKVNNSTNLAAYITVNSDPGPNYGKMTVLQVPSGTVIQGPEQLANTFSSNATISKDISLLDSGGSQVIHGNLLTLPIGESFLYVEPLYVQASGSTGYPILQRVLVAYGDKIGYAGNLADALANLSKGSVGASLIDGSSGGQNNSSSPTPSTSPPASSSPSVEPTSPPVTGSQAQVLQQLNTALTRLQAAYRSGDFAAIGQAQAEVQRLTNAYLKAQSATPTKPTPKPSSSPS
ncbi:UPF0182 family protein [Jatrophihabitans sp.]|uniref:UPF0182 family membrane protein n=1 Tax=Jatrophihabitans sp. TaxID=1932789 RepID=UPI002F084281